MSPTETLPALPATDEGAATPPRRRNREELEMLAAEFVNSRIHVREPPPRQLPKAALAAAAGALSVALLAWVMWPAGEAAPTRDAPPTAAEAEQWARKVEAERERKRQQLQQSREYLAKMAAADSALLGEMTARAQNLAARADAAAPGAARTGAAPSPSSEPTPSNEAAAPAPGVAQAANPATAPAEPAQPAEQQLAQVAAANCGIHVSELSASGKLTYADVARMKGARTDASTGHVFTPPVDAGRGRTVVFEVMPTGCVRVARQLR